MDLRDGRRCAATALQERRALAERERTEMEREQLLAAERKQRVLAETLAEVTLSLTSQMDHKAVLDEILRQVKRVVSYSTAHIALLKGDSLRAARWTGYDAFGSGAYIANLVQSLADLPLDTQVIQTRQPLVITDTRREPRWVDFEETAWIRSHICVPICLRDRVLGLLRLNSDTPDAFSAEDAERLLPLANAAAIAIQNAQLFEAEQRKRQEAEALRKASLVLGSIRDVSQMLDQLLEQIRRVIPYDSANVILIDEDMAEVTHWRGDERFTTAEAAIELRLQVQRMPHLRRLFSTRRPHIVPDTQADPEWVYLETSAWARAWAGAPIVVWDEVIGFFSLNSETPGAYRPEHVELLRAFAAHATIAVENAKLVEELASKVAARTAEIRAEQEKSETILRNVGDAIGMTDLALRVLYVNPAFTALTGYEPEEIVGRPLYGLLGEKLPEQAYQLWQRALRRGEAWQGEVVARRKDGRTYEAALTLAPVHDATGKLKGYVASHQDISLRKKLDRARSRFITNVSHELRTPVANIKLYTQLLRRGRRPEKTEGYLEALEDQSDQLHHLVQDILEITSLDSGNEAMSWEPLSLSTVMVDVVNAFQGRCGASGVVLTAEPIPRNLPVVKGDPGRLTQALTELVENALNFTPAGGQVTIETGTAEFESQKWVTLAVQDTGPGISLEEQERVFNRFYRGSLAESGHIPGAGLGLSIVQEIMRAHGGRVSVKSKPGEGSTFTLWLRSVQPRDWVDPQ